MTPESAGISGNICLLPEGAKAEKIRIKTEKLREAKADAQKRGLEVRSCARVGRKDVVGEVFPEGSTLHEIECTVEA